MPHYYDLLESSEIEENGHPRFLKKNAKYIREKKNH